MKHIAIMKSKFYNLLIKGEKTIESRWSIKKIAPYNKINVNDIIYFKESGKQIINYKAIVKKVKFFEINEKTFNFIYKNYKNNICMQYFDNLEIYKNKKYCTLVWITNLQKINPINFVHKDQLAWIINPNIN